MSDHVPLDEQIRVVRHYIEAAPFNHLTQHNLAAFRAVLATLEASRWRPIETAPKDGARVWVYVAAREGLPSFQTVCWYHPDADELREVTHWRPPPPPDVEPPQ